MVKVLIPTKPDDADAVYVKLALEKKGHECIIWYTADFPTRQTHSFELINKKLSWSARGVDFRLYDDHFDVVWLRRPRKPVLSENLHQDDIENARNENMAFFRTFWRVIAPDAFWINPIEKVNAANSKLLQLKMAVEAGFNIPDTLFSNDPEKIREFICCYRNNGVIYKTLYPVMWLGKEEMRLTYTDEIRLEDLPSDVMLQNTPGIFQNKINKAFELRITYFGETAIAVKILSQEHERGRMDWRHIPMREIQIEEFQLPREIDEKCKLFLRKMGLAMGCFDFIVTPEQEYYFLEVNEQGQFIWIEEVNPDIKMLDAFTNFLIHGSTDFKWQKSGKSMSIFDFKTELMSTHAKVFTNHVKPDSLY